MVRINHIFSYFKWNLVNYFIGEPEPTLNIEFVLPEPKEEDPELLDSDDEEAPSDIPESLRSLPDYLPPLPPKHTYLRTPVCVDYHIVYYVIRLAHMFIAVTGTTAEKTSFTIIGKEVGKRGAGTGFIEELVTCYGSRCRRQWWGVIRWSGKLGSHKIPSEEMEAQLWLSCSCFIVIASFFYSSRLCCSCFPFSVTCKKFCSPIASV